LSDDRLSENAGCIPGSKFDTWHPTNWLGYHIGRYPIFHAIERQRAIYILHSGDPKSAVLISYGGAVKSGLLLFFYSPHHKCFMSGIFSRADPRVMSGLPQGDRPIQTTTKTGGALVDMKFYRTRILYWVNPGEARLRNFPIFREQCGAAKQIELQL